MNMMQYLVVRNGYHTRGKLKGKVRTWLTIREAMLLGFDTTIRGWKKSDKTFSESLARTALEIAVEMGRQPNWNKLKGNKDET